MDARLSVKKIARKNTQWSSGFINVHDIRDGYIVRARLIELFGSESDLFNKYYSEHRKEKGALDE